MDADRAAESAAARRREPLTYFAITQAASARGAQNYQTFETDYAPARTQYWHGVTTNVNARLRNGLTLQGGTTTGRGVIDTCALMAALPELMVVAGVNQRIDSCAVTEPFMTTFRALAAYTVPKVDVLVSANMRSVPNANIGMGSNSATNGSSRAATPRTCPTPSSSRRWAVCRPMAWRPARRREHADDPGQLFGRSDHPGGHAVRQDRRFGGRRADIAIDLLNIFNTSDPTAFQETFDWATNGATYMQPTGIVSPRFVRFNVTFNF